MRLPEACFLFCNHSLRTDTSFLSPDEYVYAARLLVGLPISANLEESVRRACLFKRQQYMDLRMIVQPRVPQGLRTRAPCSHASRIIPGLSSHQHNSSHPAAHPLPRHNFLLP